MTLNTISGILSENTGISPVRL